MIAVVHNKSNHRRIAFDTKRVVSIVEAMPVPEDETPGCYIVIDGGYKGVVEESFDDVLKALSGGK